MYNEEDKLLCDICGSHIVDSVDYYENREDKKDYCSSCFNKYSDDEDKQLNLITEREVREWCSGSFGNNYTESRLLEILNEEYDLDEAISDVLSFKKFKLIKQS
jgi:hypothetical protein